MMAGANARSRKRSHDTYEDDLQLGVGQTLAYLRGEQAESQTNGEASQDSQGGGEDDTGGKWETVESKGAKRRKKLPKKGGDNYPSIAHSANSRLQSYVKLSDLQNLVLYLLADGLGPQWCSVSHHANVRKVVVLMVPGLEAGMFDGKIPLSSKTSGESKEKEEVATAADSSAVEQTTKTTEASASADNNPSDSQPVSSFKKPVPTPDDYYPKRLEHDNLPEPLQALSDLFEHIWPVKAPGDDRFSKMHSPLAAILTAPVVKSKEEKRAKGPGPPRENKNWKNERTPVTEFIAPTDDLLREGYLLHPAHCGDPAVAAEENLRRQQDQMTEADGWVDIPNITDLGAGEVPEKDIEQGSILRGRNVLSIDCEMCLTSPLETEPRVFALTRISVVDWEGAVVLDEFVKPAEAITNYLTQFSGITPAKLAGVTTTLKDIQAKLATLLTPNTILIGHSLNSDLKALKTTFPYIIDTSLIFPHPRGPPLKSSLKWLAKKYLSREIQKGDGATGHDSIEDARACLDLVKQKCEKGKLWGTSDMSNESIFKRLERAKRPKRDKVNVIGDEECRIGAVVDWGDPKRGYGKEAKVALGCRDDEEVAKGVKKALLGDDQDDGVVREGAAEANGSADAKSGAAGASASPVPRGGVDFVFARLRELEIFCGWNNRQNSSPFASAEGDGAPTASASATDKTSVTATSSQDDPSTSTPKTLSSVVSATVARIAEIHASLPPCTAFIVYSGSSDPRPLSEMQALQQRFKEEYRVKKWDELSVRWTDDEEQKLKQVCRDVRLGIGFIGVK